MTRRVSFKRAIDAGVAGAIAWELISRPLLMAGIPILDPAKLLGTMVFPESTPKLWYPVGMFFHCSVGAIWAIFYAYFFWSEFPWKPYLQGAVFSLIPTVLSGVAMLPHLVMMHPLAPTMPRPQLFACQMGWTGPASLVLGHILFGAVMGAIYIHPVGYPVRKKRLAHG